MITVTLVEQAGWQSYQASDGFVTGNGQTEAAAIAAYEINQNVWRRFNAATPTRKDSEDMNKAIINLMQAILQPALPAPAQPKLLPAPAKILYLPQPQRQLAPAYHLRRGHRGFSARAYAVVGTGVVNGRATVKLEIGSKGLSKVLQVFVDSNDVKAANVPSVMLKAA